MKTKFDTYSKGPLVIHPLEDSFAIWFGSNRQFLLLEEPACFVLQSWWNETAISSIQEECRNRYGDLLEDPANFVLETIELIKHFNQNDHPLTRRQLAKEHQPPETSVNWVIYQIGQVNVKIEYQNRQLHDLIHPSFYHLEVGGQSVANHKISCSESDRLLVVALDGEIKNAFSKEEVAYYKGFVSQLIYSLLYNKPTYDWMCTLHASGIFRQRQAILFPAAAGSGKSTIAAILKANGFDYLADDFVAASSDGNVFPFPASISVKEGAFGVMSAFYPELRLQDPSVAATGKRVRYLPVHNYRKDYEKGIPLKYFVFVKYQPNSGLIINKITKKEALRLLLEETWVNPIPEKVSAFFKWVDQTPFLQMTYSDNEEMISAIQLILDDDR